MKRTTIVAAAVIVSLLHGMPLGAQENAAAGDQPAKPCRQCAKKSLFQSSATSIETCHPKIWLLQPMKPLDPVTKEKVSFFQRLADSMHKR